MKVIAEKNGVMSFDIEQDNFHFTVDAMEQFGGENKGPRPKGLLLSGLIGCTGMDVISILKKMKVEYEDLKITAETELTDEHPKVFKSVHVKYLLKGDNIDDKKVKRAIDLSQEKYCGVSAMLAKHSEINYTIYVNNIELD